jgi:hypothetical protein
MQDAGPVCLRCVGMDHLVFLPVGDLGLTRRAHRVSELSAVVVRFSRSRERQGLLVEGASLTQAGQGLPIEGAGTRRSYSCVVRGDCRHRRAEQD